MANKSESHEEVSSLDYISVQTGAKKRSLTLTKNSSQKKKKREQKQTNKRGVVLLSHIPHGFYETQMFSFFSQFGRVTRLKLIRSKKTGRSRQFGFIEFQFEEVAKVVVETMNNYLMFQKILKCKLIPLEDLKSGTFRNWQYKYHVPKTRKRAIAEHNKPLVDPEEIAKRKKRTLEKRQALQKKLDDLGIDYDVFNVEMNKSFVPPLRTRASVEDITKLTAKEELIDDECFSQFDDEIKENDWHSDETVSPSDDIGDQEKAKISTTNAEILDSVETTNPKVQTDNQEEENKFGVMVVDLDDSEITFKTPPAEARIQKKSIRMSKGKKSVYKVSDSEHASENAISKKPLKKVSSKNKKTKTDLESSVHSCSTATKSSKRKPKKKTKLNKTM